ncbi:MAG TPA: cupin domain-containing protein [Steroidobacteraceae bacterium]|jgi:quercetin dioxygenase-like cupin family protein|nr:cupin domain-containing protein [Steroidobacteraceae bacterium]
MASRPDDIEALAALLADALVQAAPAVPINRQAREVMRQRIQARIAEAAPRCTETIRAETLAWEQWWPGVWAKVLERDPAENLQITLYRMEPGSIVPAHEHAKLEECLVLEGDLIIGSHRLLASDLHIAHAGSRHPCITTSRGARLLVRSEIAREA